ncbi:MAG: bacteriohemerythrin [Hyphomonadaceae bacterium]
MSLMDWSPALDVGVSEMNDEHKHILDAMNKLYAAHEAGVTGAEINRLVAQLGKVATEHFAHEEAFMASINFPQLATHKGVHTRLLETYAKHAGDIEAAGGQVGKDFFDFLKYWLTAHIKGIDVKYGQHAGAMKKAG